MLYKLYQFGFRLILLSCTMLAATRLAAQGADTLILRDIQWDKASPASMTEMQFPSAGARLAGFLLKANGKGPHPTLFLLHGFPGNERNLDLAQVVRARGWNVIYFDYRGSWASQGSFSFTNCVDDVVNVVNYCKAHAAGMQIDVKHMALFGHSMGGWICLKALQRLPDIQKGFALSTWDIHADVTQIKNEQQLDAALKDESKFPEYFVLNTSNRDMFLPVMRQPALYDLSQDAAAFASKQVVMLDEHHRNEAIADAIRKANHNYFSYEVWDTDHPFTNKRVALIKAVLRFLNR